MHCVLFILSRFTWSHGFIKWSQSIEEWIDRFADHIYINVNYCILINDDAQLVQVIECGRTSQTAFRQPIKFLHVYAALDSNVLYCVMKRRNMVLNHGSLSYYEALFGERYFLERNNIVHLSKC